VAHCGPDSGFNIQNDHRQMAAKNFHRVDVGRNISTSLSVDLGCLACAVPHSIREGMGAGMAQVVAVSDQSFPPILPTQDGHCVIVVRVEDGALSELVSVFTDFFANFVSPVGAFPPGSLILLGSLSHLGRRGICNYAEELVRVTGSLGSKVGVGVEIIPMVFVPLGGISDPGWVRDAYDLDTWILASGLGPGAMLGETRSQLWKGLRERADGDAGGGHLPRSLYLPASFRNPRKKVFVSGDTDPPLPHKIRPLSENVETTIIKAMLSEINMSFGFDLNETPVMERGAVTPEKTSLPGRLIIVGASHMARMASYLPQETIVLATPGFKATHATVPQLTSKLAGLSINGDDRIVLDLLSNSAFMGTDAEGLPSPAFAGEDGTYHIPGSLAVAPPQAIKKILGNCEQIGKICSNANLVVLVAPIPRYVTKKCCEDPSHTENYNCDDFELEIVSGIGTHKRLLESWAHEHSMNYILVDATELADPAEPILSNRTTRQGVPLWFNWDPVHLAPEAYKELADTALSAGDAETSDTGSEAASSASCASYGKRLPESVITMPEPPAPKRGRNAFGAKPAGWLRGQADPGHYKPAQWTTWNERGRPGGRHGPGRRPWARQGARPGSGGGVWRW
jgi:hypothetical protein